MINCKTDALNNLEALKIGKECFVVVTRELPDGRKVRASFNISDEEVFELYKLFKSDNNHLTKSYESIESAESADISSKPARGLPRQR